MFFSIVRRSAVALATTAALGLAGCAAPPTPTAKADARPTAPPPVQPVEAPPAAAANPPTSIFTLITQSPASAMLAYGEKLRAMSGPELSAELARLGDPGDSPTAQMQAALALAQTRVPADLARALGLMQRVIANPSPEAKPLQPLARALASRYMEQRRVEDDRDRQAAQLRDAQRRIDQLSDRIEALRAIERSFTRPNAAPAAGSAKSMP